MISPQHLINTGICGLFCVTLLSLSSTKPEAAPPVRGQATSSAQDYTLHIKAGKDRHQVSESAPGVRHPSQVNRQNASPRTLTQRNQQAREQRAQFEMLFSTNSEPMDGKSREISASSCTPDISAAESSAAALHRARNAVYRSIESGTKVSDPR